MALSRLRKFQRGYGITINTHSFIVECFECGATYTVTDEGEGKSKWTPHQYEIECANKNCDHKIVVWNHELECGRCWVCPACKGENTFVLAVSFKEAPNQALNLTPQSGAAEL